MQKSYAMIVITGAAGFIASVVAGLLNQEGYTELVLVDDFKKAAATAKTPNYIHKQYSLLVEREEFPSWLQTHADAISWVIHLGARTDTTEFDQEIFNHLNLNYSKTLWKLCTQFQIPLIYASSAATYGLGENGYSDTHDIVDSLKPLNPYGQSKNDFDAWALQQEHPPFWAGLKFFNVYGPNEFHKGRMASVVFHAYHQINAQGFIKLFRSHRTDIADGQQKRDFIYVKDVATLILFMLQNNIPSGLYNVGTGQARSFLDLAKSVFNALGKEEHIQFIDTPLDIRDKYQYFTQAETNKLRHTGYQSAFTSLEDGVREYVQQYLIPSKYF